MFCIDDILVEDICFNDIVKFEGKEGIEVMVVWRLLILLLRIEFIVWSFCMSNCCYFLLNCGCFCGELKLYLLLWYYYRNL